MECFRNAGKEILYEQEEFILKQYEETHRIMFHEYAEDMKDLLPPVDDDCEELSTRGNRGSVKAGERGAGI